MSATQLNICKLYQNPSSVVLFFKMLPALGGFEALGEVDDAAECRHAVDADILEFVTVAVVCRLMRHARIERIAQGCRTMFEPHLNAVAFGVE